MGLTLPLKSIVLALCLSVFAAAEAVHAVEGYDGHERPIENETPKELDEVGIKENLGAQLDLSLTFKNENGDLLPLSHYINGKKPVLLSLAYYSCPSLCNFHLNGLNDAFKQLEKPLGSEFDVLVVSIDPSETPDLAAKKKSSYINAYGRVEGAQGWHFLVGDEANIKKLAATVGFKYRWDEKEKQWAHAAAAQVLTPQGRVSRYLYGIIFDPKVLRLSMVEASNGLIGTIVDKITLFCFHFDPQSSKYTFYAFNVMRAAAGLTVLALLLVFGPFWLRSRKELQGDT